MASQAQRDKLKQLEALSEEEELFDLPVEGGTGLEEFAAIAKAAMSPLHLLLMVRHPNFPLTPGQTLYVKVSGTDRVGELTILENAHLQTPDGVKNSLAAAAEVYMGYTYANRPKSAPNGWNVVKVAGVRPGSYMSLNTLFMEQWSKLSVPVATLVDEEALAQYMVAHHLVTPEELPAYRTNKGGAKGGKLSTTGSKRRGQGK